MAPRSLSSPWLFLLLFAVSVIGDLARSRLTVCSLASYLVVPLLLSPLQDLRAWLRSVERPVTTKEEVPLRHFCSQAPSMNSWAASFWMKPTGNPTRVR